MMNEWNKELVELYDDYMDYVRAYLADNTEIKSTSERKYYINPKRVHIIDIKKDLIERDRYTYYYKISGLKRTFDSPVMSFETWERIVLRTKRRIQILKQLGI